MKAHLAIGALAGALYFGALGRDAVDDWIDGTAIPPLVVETGAEVTDRHGVLLRAYQVEDGRWRLHADLSEIDAGYLSMLVAYEDKRYYQHRGVDPVAALRAGWHAVRHGRIVSGASTLTMQTARLLEDGDTGTWAGKLRQTRLALALERQLTKAEILALYVNRAPFGGNLEGVRAASFAYFNKEPRRLTTAQSALLVALPQSPEARRPDRGAQAAQRARDLVLTRLARQGRLPRAAAESATKTRVLGQRAQFPAIAPHLSDRVSSGGMQSAQTTLDKALQLSLEGLARQALRPLEKRLSIAMIVADHRTGEVLASVGSSSFEDGPREGFVDMTRALRSPGSTLKPFIYGLGFEQGMIHPATLMTDQPMSFSGYAPQNFDGQYRGELTVRDALAASLNIPVVHLLDRIGPANLTALLRRSGAEPVIPGGQPGLAIGLGGLGISLHDLVQAYAGLAAGGHSVALAETAGTVTEPSARMLSERSAWYVGDILASIPPPDGGRSGRIAYKTGTSYGHRDALAIGFDGTHVIGIWMGRPDGTPVPGAFGADLAAPLLFEAFSRVKPQPFPMPAAPRDVLLAGTADLPLPLRRFADRDLARKDPDALQIAFPPTGARLDQTGGDSVFVQIRNGVAPFTWLANGTPVETRSFERQIGIVSPGRGYLDVTVIDARGRSATTEVFVD